MISRRKPCYNPLTRLRLAFLGLALAASGACFSQDAVIDDEISVSQSESDENSELTNGAWSRFMLSVGGMSLDADGSYRLGLPDGRKITLVDFDRAGLPDRDSSYWLSANWRSRSNRWGVWFASWDFGSSGSRLWEDEWNAGDGRVIPVGAEVDTRFDARWYVLEATYSLIRSVRYDAGIGLGVHAVGLDTSLLARVGAGENDAEIVREELSTLAPLPNVLGYFHWNVADRWTLTTRVGWFGLDYDKYSGRMINMHAIISYGLTDNWSASLGYEFVDIDVTIEQERWVELYKLDFSGPMATLRYSF